MQRPLPLLALALTAAGLALPASAMAAAPSAAEGGAGTPAENGGAAYGEHPPVETRPQRGERKPRKRRPARRSDRGRPVLQAFAVRPGRFYVFGRPARIDFQISDRSPTVAVTLRAYRAGSREPVARIELGERATGTPQTARINGREGGVVLPQGRLELRLSARDPGGRTLRASARASASAPLEFYWHRFPLAGPFQYPGEGGGFGAERPGRSHQGQDLTAAEGTPVVAPRGGVVQHVAYQAEGAGHYVILDGHGEDRDYAFMHLQEGSIAVRQGQRVRTGQLLGRVGNTGRSFGAHLHFEIWEGGGWFEGGKPVDPLPYLRRWDSWS